MALFRMQPDVTGSRKSKMAVVKPAVFISQLLDKIATLFQRLTKHFWCSVIQWHYSEFRIPPHVDGVSHWNGGAIFGIVPMISGTLSILFYNSHVRLRYGLR